MKMTEIPEDDVTANIVLPFIEFSAGLFLCLEICCGGPSTCHRD